MTTVAQQQIAAAMSEDDLQALVVDLAHFYGWRVHHTRPALRQSGGWSTPIQGNPGFTDLVLAKAGLVRFVELKSQRGKRSNDQILWATALLPHYSLWRPGNWVDGTIRRYLEDPLVHAPVAPAVTP